MPPSPRPSRPGGWPASRPASSAPARGLTPSGDDALCGVLLALRAGGAPAEALAAVGAAVPRSLAATTSLSASLLLAAAAGCAVPEVATLANAVSRGDEAGIDEALPAVLAIGHSSGADLLAGLAGRPRRH